MLTFKCEDLGRDLRICTTQDLPGDAETAEPCAIFGEARCCGLLETSVFPPKRLFLDLLAEFPNSFFTAWAVWFSVPRYDSHRIQFRLSCNLSSFRHVL